MFYLNKTIQYVCPISYLSEKNYSILDNFIKNTEIKVDPNIVLVTTIKNKDSLFYKQMEKNKITYEVISENTVEKILNKYKDSKIIFIAANDAVLVHNLDSEFVSLIPDNDGIFGSTFSPLSNMDYLSYRKILRDGTNKFASNEIYCGSANILLAIIKEFEDFLDQHDLYKAKDLKSIFKAKRYNWFSLFETYDYLQTDSTNPIFTTIGDYDIKPVDEDTFEFYLSPVISGLGMII